MVLGSQILEAGPHQVSYVIVRGSVPVYWTQPGFKYRPPPIIEKGDKITLMLVNVLVVIMLVMSR